MNAGRRAVLAFTLGCIACPAGAQYRFTTDALVGLDQMPFVVHDLEAAKDAWRQLGFLVKPGRPQPNGIDNAFIKCEDGAGIDLATALRRRLASFGVRFTPGGALDASLVVVPEVTHGLWVEFREQ